MRQLQEAVTVQKADSEEKDKPRHVLDRFKTPLKGKTNITSWLQIFLHVNKICVYKMSFIHYKIWILW